ncbi:autoinducer binding domain-containing protein [Cupriavidus basilensis]|uniref:Autoinducer binding domain-containing protein n=1 Tax=Cupriavidus basilensis TaxID=68895 RepID=A0ABT6AQE5_9BURK|nr:autoinducer binding domain-containing protein [Cupriavidus basilensis]MDF3834846.1 autoinducer binding domain-containing protein [Cupriavidus basilensis]
MADVSCAREAFGRVEKAVRALGFDMCAYGIRMPLPVSKPRTIILNNFPAAWQARYQEANYLGVDPTVAHGRRTAVPLVWTDDVFSGTRALWEEARAAGLRVGWSQSCFSANGVGGMLSMARSSTPISRGELDSCELRMRSLVCMTHATLSRILCAEFPPMPTHKLTRRETEVLRWAADGKTSGEIASILKVSVDTVNFHIKNAVHKMNATNKTGAVVRAAMLGLLH